MKSLMNLRVDNPISDVRASDEPSPRRRRACRYLWLPVALGAVAMLLLLLVAGATLWNVACGLVFLAVTIHVGRVLDRSHTLEVDAAARAAAQPAANLRDLCGGTLPVWRRQVDTSRGEADAAVADLTRAFAGITEKLNKVMQTSSARTGDEIMMDAISRSSADFDGLVGALRLMQQSKDGMVREISAQAASLKDNAAEVRGIAMQTRILTLNAAIEAARAGEAGAPFAVIVGEMRQLAARTADTSEKISKQTEVLNVAVEAALKESVDSSTAGTSIAQAQAVIRDVVTSFQMLTDNLSASVESMARERDEVRDEISNALVSLQFQDRVSQILMHVSHSMEMLTARLAEGSLRDSDVKAWVDEMSQAYTTSEEFDNLHYQPRGKQQQAGNEISYF